MVELHARQSAACGWSEPPVRSGKHLFLSAGRITCVVDFLTIFTLPCLGSFFWQSTESLKKNLWFWSLIALSSVLLAASHGGYGTKMDSRQRAQYGLAANCFLATSLGMLTLAVILGHPNILNREWVAADLVITPFLLVVARAWLAPRFANKIPDPATPGPLLVSYNSCPADLSKALVNTNIADKIEGVLYLAPSPEDTEKLDWPLLPDLASLRAKLRQRQIRDVIFVHHPAFDSAVAGINLALWEEVLSYPARIWLAFDVGYNLPEMLREKSGGFRLVPIVTDEFLHSNNSLKRIFDIVSATILVALFSPVMLLCAAAIRGSSPGPILFRQVRIGAHGHEFELLKFRSMRHEPSLSFSQAVRHDPRITAIGHLLRRSSLDELPQFINVIRGDMSLVGPRPHAPETQVGGMSFENALRLYQIRHRVKPGMTGLAQVRGLRGATPVLKTLELRLASDLEYIQSWSIWLDLSILLQTLPAVVMQTNAW